MIMNKGASAPNILTVIFANRQFIGMNASSSTASTQSVIGTQRIVVLFRKAIQQSIPICIRNTFMLRISEVIRIRI